jgi:TolB protein
MMNADGSNGRLLTDESSSNRNPAVSPDGRYLVFLSSRSGIDNLWRMNLDGSNLKQLTTAGGFMFDFSPDGRWVVFSNRETDFVKLFKISIDGGSPVRLYDQPSRLPAVSPDGKLIACLSTDRQSGKVNLLILPFEGGAPLKTLDAKAVNISDVIAPRWTPDGRALIYANPQQGRVNLWRVPLDGSPPQQVTHFNDAKPERIWNFDLSRDGKQLVIARGSQSADVVLISEVKQQ